VVSHYIYKHYKRFQPENRQIVNYKHEIKQAMTSEVTTPLYRPWTYHLQGNQARENIKSFGVYTLLTYSMEQSPS